MSSITETESEMESEFNPLTSIYQHQLQQIIGNYSAFNPPLSTSSQQAQQLIGNYLANKQGEISQCSRTYSDMLRDSNGAAFINILVDPIYNQIKTKTCNPETLKTYIQHSIDVPDTVYDISNKLNTIDARLGYLENKIDTTVVEELERHQYGYSWFDGKTIMILSILILCFLCLAISIFCKSTGISTEKTTILK